MLWHRYAVRQSWKLLALGLWLALTFASARPALADDPDDDPLLDPAPKSDVSIVPTDRTADQRVEPPKPADSEGRKGVIDLADLDPVRAAGWTLLVLGSVAATGVGLTRLIRMLYVWRSPASLGASGFGPLAGPPSASFSLLVPVPRSDDRVGETLDRLARLEGAVFEVVAVVAYDDLPGRAAAVAAAARHPERVRSFVDRHHRRNRAARLNAALAGCGGQVVGVVEVGDEVHPRLLCHVDACLADPAVGAVQGGVRQVATAHRWFTASSVVEQYFWSRSRLHFHAEQNFTPLDSSSVFVRAALLREAGGWDVHNAWEGCELGIRLSVRGTPIVVAYDPELATRTPAPGSFGALVGAHRRRIRGFVQVLRKGVWRELPTRRQRLLARAALARPFVEGVTSLAVAVGIVGALVVGAGPLALGLVLLPAVPVLIGVGVALAGLSELGRLEGRRVRARERLCLVAASVPYHLVVGVTALVALVGRGREPAPVPVAPAREGALLDLGDSWGEPVETGRRQLPA